MINSRKIEDLVPDAQIKCRQFLSACSEIGLNVKITQTRRDAEYQNSLYQQGRTVPGKIVTNVDGYKKKSNHQSGQAWDAVPLDSKGQINWTDEKLYRKMADVAVKLGITAGFYWKSFKGDMGHFEIN